ncbi:MAG: J domain-containing protein [Pseudomonadota bacterium]
MARSRRGVVIFSSLAVGRGPRGCDHPGCLQVGEYRAPRSRHMLTVFYWFCLEHVRAYNAAWDYYRGMSAAEIEACRRADTVGWRPTWPMGPQRRFDRLSMEELRAAFARLFDGPDILGAGPAWERPRLTPEDEALAVLDLRADATMAQIKARYRELVKRHHPDANGGDKAAEERLKSINQAYAILKAQGAKLAVGG